MRGQVHFGFIIIEVMMVVVIIMILDVLFKVGEAVLSEEVEMGGDSHGEAGPGIDSEIRRGFIHFPTHLGPQIDFGITKETPTPHADIGLDLAVRKSRTL